MNTLPIHEAFFTWQGEGTHTGRAAFFIRTLGCPIHCEWCDSAGTWHPEYIPDKVERLTPSELADRASKHSPEFVVLTGGEPAIHDLTELTTELKSQGLDSHLETSGAFPLRGTFKWVTVSPKWWKVPLPETLAQADELKLIVEDEHSIEKWMEQLGGLDSNHPTIWLHPEWSQRNNPRVLESISTWVKTQGAPFRVGWQLHKLYNVDALDPASRNPTPLGGNPELGF